MVINPGSGPGPNALPDGNYTREVPKLAAHDNVRLLGYVATTYATRDASLVRKDIETYAAWPEKSSNPDLAVRGIFFDETPQQYSDKALAYLQNLTDFVKATPELGPDNYVCHRIFWFHLLFITVLSLSLAFFCFLDPSIYLYDMHYTVLSVLIIPLQVVHNPGVIPDSRYLPSADSTVVFEASYATFQERHGAKLFEAIPNSRRGQLCAVIHSVPDSVEGSKLRGLVKQVRRVADEVFITHLSTDYYASFGDRWSEFVSVMAL